MYTYIARGLGSKLGFLAGWGFGDTAKVFMDDEDAAEALTA